MGNQWVGASVLMSYAKKELGGGASEIEHDY
jgi:hypothetical protein